MDAKEVGKNILCLMYHDFKVHEIYPVKMMTDDKTSRKITAFVVMKCSRCGHEKHLPKFED